MKERGRFSFFFFFLERIIILEKYRFIEIKAKYEI